MRRLSSAFAPALPVMTATALALMASDARAQAGDAAVDSDVKAPTDSAPNVNETPVCPPFWWPIFQGDDHWSPIRAFGVFDSDRDGSAELYGLRTRRSSSGSRAIMRWEGGVWRDLPGSPLSAHSWGPGQRGAMIVHDDDGDPSTHAALFVAGRFGEEYRKFGSPVRRFDGEAWTSLVATTGDPFVYDLEAFDEDGDGSDPSRLFVCGNLAGFEQTDSFRGVARWDGASWSMLGTQIGDATVDPIQVYDLQVFDPDASGPMSPALIAGGWFESDEEGAPSFIASWDGQSWSALGFGQPLAPNHPVLGMAVYDEDQSGPAPPRLFAVCETQAEWGAEDHDHPGIVRWDGQQWSGVGGASLAIPPYESRDGPFFGRAFVHDDDGGGPTVAALYVSLPAISDGPSGARGIARWDGVSWTDFGGSLTNSPSWWSIYPPFVDTFASFDFDGDGAAPPKLVVGGGFSQLGMLPHSEDGQRRFLNRVSANFVATWNGDAWEAMGRGLSFDIGNRDSLGPYVTSLNAFDADDDGPAAPALIAAGNFSTAGSIAVRGQVAGPGYGAEYDDFRGAVASWNAIDGWRAPRFAPIDESVPSYSAPPPQHRVHDSIRFAPLSGTSGVLYAVGSFSEIDGHQAASLARFTGGEWRSFGVPSPQAEGSPATPTCLETWDHPAADVDRLLIVGGSFHSISDGAGGAIGRVVAFDGSAWLALGAAEWSGEGVEDLAIFDVDGAGPLPSRLIAAGSFSLVDGAATADDIAVFDGASWSPLGQGRFESDPSINGSTTVTRIRSVAVFDEDGPGPGRPALFAAGNFARWTGALHTTELTGIARWNGAAWSAVGPPLHRLWFGAGPFGNDLAIFDPDGPGVRRPGLVLGGVFSLTSTDQHLMDGIAMWNGTGWLSLGSLRDAPSSCYCDVGAQALEVFDDDQGGPNPPALFVAGYFLSVGANQFLGDRVSSWAIAKYGPACWPDVCTGDSNRDGVVNFADITETLKSFGYDYGEGASSLGDSDFDGLIGIKDVTATLANWGAACPPSE